MKSLGLEKNLVYSTLKTQQACISTERHAVGLQKQRNGKKMN